ncbi:MAG: hypothetical protein WBN92_01680 [Terriglobia bacterium]
MITRRALKVLILFFVVGTTFPANADEHGKNLQANVQEVTLLSRRAHKEEDNPYGKSVFNFRRALRSDSKEWLLVTRNIPEIEYDSSWPINEDSDWFSLGTDSASKIKDLGALQWSEVESVPILPAPLPALQGVKGPRPGETWEESSGQRVTQAVEGHVYVVHVKDTLCDHQGTPPFVNDFYVMFRVEKLEPGDRCTISWKQVPWPEGKKSERKERCN